MDLHLVERHGQHRAATRAPWAMNIKLTPAWFYRALIVILSVWILHSFLAALLAACVTAVASWPLYTTVRRPSAVAHRRQRDVSDLHVRDGCVRASTVDICLRGPTHRSSLAAPRHRGCRPARNCPSSLVGECAAGRPVGGGTLARRARAPGDAHSVAAADRPDSATGLGAITGTVHGSPCVHHCIHHPAVVLSVSGR